ncbi:hypothetical protein [Tepidibacillus fermentans]|uniref:Uncharacterized protein YpmB n=1 Tax=Tepidibacillus fermentans TaxID=1281767 RepID=A0A4R3KK59_9BACI|nr:hypothetical protein [Tepidibacillus fermentans]TCS84173.1 uncharacterized protein YpmB [Tepidibacillus fermentans]
MKRFILVSSSIIILFLFISFLFLYSIWAEKNTIEKQMIDKVKDRLPMINQIEQVDYYAGEKAYYVMFAKDRFGDPLFIWTNEEELRYRYLNHYLTKEQIKKLVSHSEKNLTVKRITTGIIDQERLIYEVLYEDQGGRLGYLYYDLQNGGFIKKYRLGVTTS